MGDEASDLNKESSKIFTDDENILSSDEQLALHIIHKFNIDRETIECMPAFEDHIKPFFCKDDLSKKLE